MFIKSAVEREFLRQAERRGKLDPTPEEVVEAAVKEKSKLKSSDDLYSDLLVFASNLRERGFEKTAVEIENSALMFKQAEVHLYRVHDEDGEDILEFAHPKEYSVGEATEGLADVETLLSQHKKILDVVNKEPSGKLASLALLIVKEAQEEGGEEVATKGTHNINFSPVDEKFKSALNAFNATADDGKEVTAFTEQRLMGLNPGFLKEYTRYSGVAGSAVEQYKNYIDSLYAGKPATAATIAGSINASNYDQLASWVSRNYPDLVSYVTGSQSSVTKSLAIAGDSSHPIWQDNNGSVWKYPGALDAMTAGLSGKWLKDSAKVNELANKIQEKVVAIRNSVLGPKVDAANGKLEAAMKSALGPLFTFKFEDVSYDPAIKETVNRAIEKLNEYLGFLSSCSSSGSKGKAVASVFGTFHPSGVNQFFGTVASLRKTITKVLSKVGEQVGGDLGQVVGDTSDINEKYKESIGVWEKFIRSLPDTAKEDLVNVAKGNLETSKRFYAATKPDSASGRPYSVLYKTLGVKALDSYGKLAAHAEEWINFTRQQTGIKEAAIVSGLYKIAVPIGGVALPGNKPAPTTQPTQQKPEVGAGKEKPAGQPGPATTQQAPAVSGGRPTKEEYQYVSLLQTVLGNFATALTEKRQELATKLTNDKDPSYRTTEEELSKWAAALQDTSEKPLGRHDGKWGTKTRGAIDYINVIKNRALTSGKFNQAEVMGLNLIQDMHWTKNKPEEVIAAAKTNIDSIQKLMRMLEAGKYISPEVQKASPQQEGQSGEAIALDTLPTELNDGNIKEPESKQGIPLRTDDLSSLRSLHLLVSRLNVYGQEAGPEVSVAKMDKALRWMRYRAAEQLNAAQMAKSSGAGIKEKYLNLIDNAIRSWLAVRDQFSPSGVIVPDKRLDVSLGGERAGKKDTGTGKERRKGRGGDFGIPESDKADEESNVGKLRNLMLGRQIDLVELAENSGDKASAEMYSKFLTAPIMSLDQFQHFNPASFWQIFMPQEMQARFVKANQHPASFARMMEQYIRNTINKAFGQVYRIVKEELPGANEDTRKQLQKFIADQEKLRDNWISKLAALRGNAIDWGANSPEVRPY